MKSLPRLPLSFLLVLSCCLAHGLTAADWLIDDRFDSLAFWDDMSTAVSWTGQPADGSAWQTTGGILGLNAAGIASVGDRPWNSVDKSRSFTAIDRQFAEPLEHRGGTLVIEVRVRWKVFNYTPFRGEWNRINLMLVHDYPEGGLDLTRDLKVTDFTSEWWGRPAYQVRLRSTDAADATSLLMYGGGNDVEGEFEIYSEGGPQLWWLAGFSSTAGGSGSNGGPSPGVGDAWPFNGWAQSSTGLASQQWQRFRYVVAPGYQALYIDPDDDGAGWIRDGYMPLPEEADAPSTAPLYNYFEHFEGLRVYFRGRDDSAEMDYLQAWFAENTSSTPTLHNENGQWLLRFPTLPGKTYIIQRSTDLSGWTPVSAAYEGDGFEAEIEVEGEPGANRAFFRLDITDAPSRDGGP